MSDLLIRFVAAAVLAVSWVMAWVQITQAGRLPGEGFTASVLMVLVVLLQLVVLGRDEAARRLPLGVCFAGFVGDLALLAGLAVGPLLAGRPLLQVFKWGGVSSTTLFDVALFGVVAGGMLTAFAYLEEPEA